MERRILNGWKDISSYLERGSRTAQRWEQQFGMPIHRPASKRRTAVVAFSDELDAWLVRNHSTLRDDQGSWDEDVDPSALRRAIQRLQMEARELAAKLSTLEQHLGRVNGVLIPHEAPHELRRH